MNNETQNTQMKKYVLSVSILIAIAVLSGAWVYATEQKRVTQNYPDTVSASQEEQSIKKSGEVLPDEGVVLPVVWGDLGVKLTEAGVINADAFTSLYEQRGGFTDEYHKLLLEQDNGNLKITSENAEYLLNLFWALGLAQKNEILERGEMMNPAYGGAGNFASTGGWTLAHGDAMDHYSQHNFFTLTQEQQEMVDRVSSGIYRPCCGNATNFPDCNHGMAMLGLLQLMASQGATEQEMWDAALSVNSYWFPETYLTLAEYFSQQGVSWDEVDPQIVLGKEYSSSSGYQRILQEVKPVALEGGGGCGV